MPTYKVCEGREIWHSDRRYEAGEIVEISKELAAVHRDNLEPYVREKENSLTDSEPSQELVRENSLSLTDTVPSVEPVREKNNSLTKKK